VEPGAGLAFIARSQEYEIMSREQKSNKENKKKAALTPKEKKAAKRLKKETKPFVS
jgi:hypothetical protein